MKPPHERSRSQLSFEQVWCFWGKRRWSYRPWNNPWLKSIKMSVMLRRRPPKPYKFLKFIISLWDLVIRSPFERNWDEHHVCLPIFKIITEIKKHFKSLYMVLADSVSTLDKSIYHIEFILAFKKYKNFQRNVWLSYTCAELSITHTYVHFLGNLCILIQR